MHEYCVKKELFGDFVEIVLKNCDDIQGEIAAKEAYKEGLRLQKIFNFYDPKSELSKLNKKRKLKVSNELLEVIKKALEFCKETNGTYDISLGKLFLARKKGEKEPKLNCSYKDILITKNEIILNHEDVLIDLGSCAKGYIADKMLEKLKEEGIESGLIDARGDICAFGEPIKIQIQHPRNKNESLGEISLKDESVATSADYAQYKENYTKSHIINKEFISVTIISKSLFLADLLATALSVSKKNNIINLIKQNKFSGMCVDDKLNIVNLNSFEKRLNQ